MTFPVPEVDDEELHVWISVGHGQMMTDAMSPLGLSVWRMTAARPMSEAGGRLFVDVTAALASPAARAGLLATVGRSDPLTADALRTVVDSGILPDAPPAPVSPSAPTAARPADPPPLEADPGIVAALIERSRAAHEASAARLLPLRGAAVFDAVLDDVEDLKRVQFDPLSQRAVMAGMEAAWWLDDRVAGWSERRIVDALVQAVPDDVTAEMGLALLDVADAIRPHPQVVARLEEVSEAGDAHLLDHLEEVEGGAGARVAIEGFLGRFGMRCTGEIDIARPRWTERPDALVPTILADVAQFEHGEASRRVERGRRAAADAERELLAVLRSQPDGAARADEAARMIERLRTFAGYREHPKYWLVQRWFLYKRLLVREAEQLVAEGVLGAVEDIHLLRFSELHDVVRTGRVDRDLLERRRLAHRVAAGLVPPRVLTSAGDAIEGSYRRDDVPSGALLGLGVSAGSVEGRARVVRDLSEAEVDEGDILVAAGTDPGWTPLLVAVAGLVTEVGGMMTHGAVVAREYGLPAVVGVPGATRRIRDGQRIRVDGASGVVELLP